MQLHREQARAPLNIGQIDLVGHSVAAGGGVAATLGMQDGFAFTVARALGATSLRDLAVGGSIACWPNATATAGTGGWGWVIGGQSLHGVAAGESGWMPPYLPARNMAIVFATENDLAILGSQKPRPMQEALRSLLSWAVSSAFIDDTDASWTFGAGFATSTLGGVGSGATSSYRFSTTLNDTATLTVPSSFPGSPSVLAIDMIARPTDDLTVGVTVDGVAQPDVRLNGADVCDSGGGGKLNAITLRFPGLAAGAHSVVLTLKTQTIAASMLIVNSARIEADPADGPVVIVPSSIRPAFSDYSLWNTYAHGPLAGTDPMNDAAVASWQTSERSVVAEFGDNIRYVDIDGPLNKTPAYFTSDNIHPNDLGHSVIADAVLSAVKSPGVLTRRRLLRPAILPGPAFTRVVGGSSGPAFVNSWINTPSRPPLAYFRDVNGLVHMRGSIQGGTGSANTVTTLGVGFRPAYDMEFVGISTAGLLQRWKLTSAGVLNIDFQGSTVRSALMPSTFSPAS